MRQISILVFWLLLSNTLWASCDDGENTSLKVNLVDLSQHIEGENNFELTPFEKNYFDEINLARTKPQQYADFLQQRLDNFVSETHFNEDGRSFISKEGKKAVIEAIEFLRSSTPLPPLKLSQGLTNAGRDHVKDLGEKGKTGHYSSNGDDPRKRIEKYGSWGKAFAENISYSPMDPRGHVVSLIVDDGVPSRGHRKNIFNKDLKIAGAGCGSHLVYLQMCVMDFTGHFEEGIFSY